MLSSYLTGYFMDHDYKTVERQYRIDKNIPTEILLNKKELADFPTE